MKSLFLQIEKNILSIAPADKEIQNQEHQKSSVLIVFVWKVFFLQIVKNKLSIAPAHKINQNQEHQKSSRTTKKDQDQEHQKT